MRRRGKKWLIVVAVGTVALLALVPPILHLVKTAYRDTTVVERLPAGYADDVSRLDKTQVAEIWNMPSDSQKGEDELRQVLRRAQVSHLHLPGGKLRHTELMPIRREHCTNKSRSVHCAIGTSQRQFHRDIRRRNRI